MTARITAVYHVAASHADIKARAQSIAVEQSVEMPVSAITDSHVLDDIVGKVEDITDLGHGRFEVRIGLATATFTTSSGPEAGQMMNMLFGNSSILTDVTLQDVIFPDSVATAFGGPALGLAGLRTLAGADTRPMTCSALKPQGLDAKGLAAIAGALAAGGLDFIKDDHGLADQAYSPFAERVPRIAETIAAHGRTVYLPSLSGNLDQLRAQIKVLRGAGLKAALIAPMIVGLATFHCIRRENPDLAFMAHPAWAGAARIAPPLLLGKIFRLMGADASVFPNHGGRFGYSPETCKALADSARASWCNLRATTPVPAGGMNTARVNEMLRFYGADVMLLIGGALLAAGPRMRIETAAFVTAVANWRQAHGG